MCAPRPNARSGIAIGPILFVVAILAVLVGVIASGSGGFTTSSGEEKTRLQASQVLSAISQAQIGVDRLMAKGVATGQVVGSDVTWYQSFNDAQRTANAHLWPFTPQGGGVARPQFPMGTFALDDCESGIARGYCYENDGGFTFFRFAFTYDPGSGTVDFGTSAEDLYLVSILETRVCEQIHATLYGRTASGSLSVPVYPTLQFDDALQEVGTSRKRIFCLENNGNAYLYAFLAIR